MDEENKVNCSVYGDNPQECELYPDCDDCSGNITKLDMTQEEPDIEFIKLVIGDNVKQLNKLHYERMKEKVKGEVLTTKKRIGRCLQHEPWITMENWECMSHSQYHNKFFVVELVWEIGCMGKHFVCMLDKSDNFIIDCDWGSCRVINKDKIAAIMPFNPYNEKTLCL